ncbi:hypothetical protein M8818_005039 [Zalaria obscura]|uniref:Uncharacterized protein n=1 Tax=Zalaria obscura TaxID=2024903 RepID=A0ACC3SBQ3_9PEZI
MADVEEQARLPEAPPEPHSIYTPAQKSLIVLLVSVAATFSGFASNIYFPSIPTIASNLSVSVEAVNLTVTGYLIFQGLSPTLWGAVSDTYGRRVTYICTFVVFIGACVGLALTKDYAQLLVLRCLQSTGSASTIAIGAGVVGDITVREERGGYMGWFQAGLLLPTAVGPLIGGAIADSLGWRAIFWFLTIYGGAFLIFLIVLLPETLRTLVGNGSIPPKGLAKSVLAYLQRRRSVSQRDIQLSATAGPTQKGQSKATDASQPAQPSPKKKIDILGTLRILLQFQATFAIVFIGIYYMVWQMVLTILSTLFKSTYQMSDLQIGLVYIANGVGCMVGTALTGKFLDWDYRRIKKQYAQNPDEFPLEQARLRTVWVYGPVQCASVLVFGWTLDKDVHVSVPIICLFFLGWTAISIQSTVATFLVDIYPDRSASATAALNLARCLLGAAGTAAVSPCVKAMGVGWTMTLFTAIMAACAGLIVVQLVCGPAWRRRREIMSQQPKP